MAQTARPFSELETLFADGVDKAITALRLRDFLESAMGCYGSMYVDSGSTPEGLTITLQKLTGWTSAGLSRNVLADPGNDRLIINADGVYLVDAFVNFAILTAPDSFLFEVQVNGVKLPGCSCEFGPGSPPSVIPARFGGRPVALIKNDYVEIWAATAGGAGDLAMKHAHLAVNRVG